MTIVRQTSFKTGEIDPLHYTRSDFPEYLTAAQSLKNMEINVTGSARKRMGTLHLGLIENPLGENAKIAQIRDKNNNTYLVLISDQFYVYDLKPLKLKFTIKSPYPSIEGVDWANDNDALIFVKSDYPPGRLYFKGKDLVYETLDIYPMPAYDFGDFDYSKITFNINNNVINTTSSIPKSYLGGQFLAKGNSIEDPVGCGIINHIDTYSFTVDVNIPFMNGNYLGSKVSLRAPAFSNEEGWPSKVIYYQNRLWFAATAKLPSGIFGSKINRPVNFDVGTGKDSEAIIYSIGQEDCGNILWLNGGKQLEIYTENYEFSCQQGQDQPLTPSTFNIKQQSSFGVSEKIKPVTYMNDSYYVGKEGNSILNFKYQGIGQSYLAANVSMASQHLVKSPIKSILLRGTDSSQDNFIYFLNPDGSLTTFQYAAEVGLAALTPIFFNENIHILDIETINNSVYLFAKYKNKSYGMLEMYRDFVLMDSAAYVDVNSEGNMHIPHLNGIDKVQITFENQDFGLHLCKDKIINIPILASKKAFVGLNFDVELKSMYYTSGPDSAPYKKFITKAFVDYYKSFDFYVNGKLVNYQYYAGIEKNNIFKEAQTGVAIIDYVSGWHQSKNLTITQTAPYDLHIISIAYQINYSTI